MSFSRIALVALLCAAACGGGEKGGTGPVAVATLQAADGSAAVAGTVGATVATPLRVRALDATGAPVAGATIAWTPSSGGTASPTSTTTGADGVAATMWTLGTATGSQTLAASTGGAATVTFTATAAADRPAAITVTRDTTVALVAGAVVKFSAAVRDRFGNPLATAVRWATSDAAVATIDSLGTLRAFDAGAVTVIATADTASGRVALTIARPAALAVSAFPTDTLRPRAAFTIDGSGFVPSAMTVSVAGIPAVVTGGTATRLLVSAPPQTQLACASPSLARVVVRRQSGSVIDSAVGQVPLDPATAVALQPGDRVVTDASSGTSCARLLNAGHYVVSLFNTDTAVRRTVSVQLRGRDANAPLASRAPYAERVSVRSARTISRAAPRPQLEDVAHAEHLERDRARLSRLRLAAPRRALLSAAAPSVGDAVTLNAMYFDCTAPTAIRGRVAAVGNRAVIVEDVAAPGAGTRDAIYRALADEFDKVMYPLITQYFGDPLAMDARFNGDGHVRILVTPYVTDSVPNTVGFVTGCNFTARATLPSSNEAAVFYARPPLAIESNAEWQRNLRTTLLHETKHLAAYAERFARAGTGAPVLEETWLEEATARLAEELYARTFSGAAWKGNATYAPTVGCEVTRCDARPLGMYRHFETLADYYSRVDSLTPLGRTSPFDGTFYASGWLLVRWAIDQFATDEAAFTRALTTEVTATGLTNLARRAGRSSDAMLPDWALAMAVDDRPGFTPRTPLITIPSWNTRDVFRGLNAYNAFQFPRPFPLLVRSAPAGDFLVDVPLLRSYTSAFVETGLTLGTRQLLSAQSAGGGAPPSTVGMAIVRID